MDPDTAAALEMVNIFWGVIKFGVGLIVIIVFFYMARNISRIRKTLDQILEKINGQKM